MKQPDSINRLIRKFSSLPGVGTKTAARYAYHIIEGSKEYAKDFCDAILDVKEKVRLCSTCGNLSETQVCQICTTRDHSQICVVAYPKDALVIEKAGFKGVYHVLHGTLSPLDGRGPDDIRIKELLTRLTHVKEIIMATNPDVEGEATAVYLARLIKPMGIEVTRLAQGISMGSEIEYADEVTLSRALSARTAI